MQFAVYQNTIFIVISTFYHGYSKLPICNTYPSLY